MGESQVTTLMPASAAALAAGAIWSPALLEIITALTPWVLALVTISIWPATLFSAVGPVKFSASGFCSSLAASSAPSCAWSNTAMPRNLGNKIIFAALPGVALTGPLAAGAAVGAAASVGAAVGAGACVGAAAAVGAGACVGAGAAVGGAAAAVVGAAAGGVAAPPHAASSSDAMTQRLVTTLSRLLIVRFL